MYSLNYNFKINMYINVLVVIVVKFCKEGSVIFLRKL